MRGCAEAALVVFALSGRAAPFPADMAAFGPAASALALGGDWEGAIEVLEVGALHRDLNNVAVPLAGETVHVCAYFVPYSRVFLYLRRMYCLVLRV